MGATDEFDDRLLDGTQKAISAALGMIPEVGGFVSLIFDLIWDAAFAGRKAQEQMDAMNSMFLAVQKMIDQSIDEVIIAEGTSYNKSMAEYGQDYHISVTSFKNGDTEDTSTIRMRFENCKSTLVKMLNLFSTDRYLNVLVMSYGNALSMYTTLLREMVLNGKDTGYTPSEIAGFQDNLNEHIETGLQVLGTCLRRMAPSLESGHLNDVEWIGDGLQKLVCGIIGFNTAWYPKPLVLATQEYEWAFGSDEVHNNACYQLRTHSTTGASLGVPAAQHLFAGDHYVHHIYENLQTRVQLARFAVIEGMTGKLRAAFLEDNDHYDDQNVEVTVDLVSSGQNTTVATFNLQNPNFYARICSFPWVRLYRPGSRGYPFSGNPDKTSVNMTIRLVEFNATVKFEPSKIYHIYTKAAASTVKNYYIIGFQLMPQ